MACMDLGALAFMAAIDARQDEGDASLTLGGAMRLLLTQAAGVCLALAGGFAGLAILFHDPLDPSWNAATGQAVSNRLGAEGAAVGDLMLQLLGWAAPAAALVIAAGGLKLVLRPRARRSGGMRLL